MVTLRSLVATGFVGAAFVWQSCLAHSLQRNPVTYVTLIDDADIKTPSHRIHAYSAFDLTFTLHNGEQHVRLALEPNLDILHDEFTVSYLDHDGRLTEKKTIDRMSHKVFRGYSFIQRGSGEDGWSRAGIARISVHKDGSRPVFDGHFRIDGNNHHIQTVGRYMKLKRPEDPDVTVKQGNAEDSMVVWRDSDLERFAAGHTDLRRDASNHIYSSNDSICDSGSLSFNNKLDEQLRVSDTYWGLDAKSLWTRQNIDGGSNSGTTSGQNLTASIGSTDGCPIARKVALVGLATDCTYWDGFQTEGDIRNNVVGMVNQASEVYENTFRISLAIRDLVISKKGCPGTPADSAKWNVACGNTTDITDRLSLFSAWRGQQNDTNAYWTLLTTCNTLSAVGLAWRGQLCKAGSGQDQDTSGNSETVAGANVVVKTDTEWQVFAHETGHIFGAVHDCTSQTCPITATSEVCCPLSKTGCDAGGKYIMNPSTGDGITSFSPCSIGNICSGLKGTVDGSCLSDNKNIQTELGSQCGNGIVEAGEECDCGTDAECKQNSCCDSSTCKFRTGAVCDPTNEDCCTDKCQFASSSTVCRASTGACDVAETCPGNSGSCPDDKHQPDGASCGSSGQKLSCASGQCTSRDLQCQNMSGLGTSNNSNNTGACSADNSCALTCQSADYAPNECVSYSQNFLDGTSCGAGGRCSDGQCKGSTTSKEIKQWIDQHKSIVIPVAAILGVLLLAAIGSCVLNCVRRRRRAVPKQQPTPPQMNSWPGQEYGAGGAGAGANWGGNGRDTAGSYYAQPPPGPPAPPPAYNQFDNGQYQYQQPPHPPPGREPRARLERWG